MQCSSAVRSSFGEIEQVVRDFLSASGDLFLFLIYFLATVCGQRLTAIGSSFGEEELAGDC